jgi:serine/threonine-protein kinase
VARRFADRYELREVVGIGGMSEVHLARDLRLDRDVAVKVLHADLAKDPNVNARFRREAQKTAGLNHPAIAAVYDAGETETSAGPLLYIVMEYVDGLTLRDVVRARGAMTPRRAIAVIADVCEALEFSHRHGIIHRDVKPANIMMTAAGAVKVVDFGIARALADSDNSVTRTGAVMGTAHYLSPEQARGGQVDARSDVYSLGCVLYEISTGEPPFTGDSPVAIAYQHVHSDPGVPSSHDGQLTPDFDAIVLKAMAKDPDDRYQSAAELRVDLIRLQNGDAPYAAAGETPADLTSPLSFAELQGAIPPNEHVPTRQPRRRGSSASRRLMAIGGLTVLAVVVTIAITLARGGSGDAALPDVRGQALPDAIAILHDRGLSTHVQKMVDPTVPADHVIDTEPAADTAVGAGGEITINVSTGPAQNVPDAELRVVPDVSSLTYAEAIRVLTDAGFLQFQQASLPSSPELKDRVLATNPFANRTVESTAKITVVMGSGPMTDNP